MPGYLVPIEEVKKIFFKGMLQGWVSGKKPRPVDHLSGYVGYEFKEGGLQLIDRFTPVVQELNSGGYTEVWCDEFKIWRMNYNGWYTPEALPFLQRLLKEAYEQGQFFGGRGAEKVVENSAGGLEYTNDIRLAAFSRFEGEERMRRSETRQQGAKRLGYLVGLHSYSGGSVIEAGIP